MHESDRVYFVTFFTAIDVSQLHTMINNPPRTRLKSEAVVTLLFPGCLILDTEQERHSKVFFESHVLLLVFSGSYEFHSDMHVKSRLLSPGRLAPFLGIAEDGGRVPNR